jgi:ribose transport system permease protein
MSPARPRDRAQWSRYTQQAGLIACVLVLAAVIIGGTSLFGGTGTIAGSALGAILFAEINNGLQVINVDPLYQNIFIGVILVAAVAIDQYRRKRRYRT